MSEQVTVTSQMVVELRDLTNAPLMVCKQALIIANGDIDKAIDLIRKSFWRMQ